MKTRALVAVVSVLVLGCSGTPVIDAGTGGNAGGGSGGGSGGGTATGGGTGGVSLEGLCAAQQAAHCAKEIRCGAAAPGADCQKLAAPSRNALSNGRVDCLSASLRANIASGRTRFDGVKARQCLTAIETTSACALNALPTDPSCNEVYTGTVAPGGSCYGFNECEPGFYCDSTLNVCPGSCQPRVGAGNVAPSVLACATGLSGAFSPDGGSLCVAPVAEGQSCTALPGSFFPLPCAGATSCQSAGDGGSTCQPLKTAGQACVVFAFNECAIDTSCAPGRDGGTQCVALARMGQPCGPTLSCQKGLACRADVCSSLIAEGGVCTSDADCVAGRLCKAGSCQPAGGPDAGCNTAPFQGDCAVGLFCNGAARCEVRRGLDAGCTGTECSLEQGLSCDSVSSRCRPFACTAP
ncbi:MAG: hypothetical protein Q8N23_23210 [Archangium sp.]|nr:hypothetical protein [Archangium sp.]MDP3570794.1 hypothetical protein [Archangium sp.]